VSPTPLSTAVGERLRAIRREQGLSQDELVRTLREIGGLGWNRSTIAKLEGATRELGLEEALLICAALQIRLADLAPSRGAVGLGDGPVSAAAVEGFLSGRSAKNTLLPELVRPRARKAAREITRQLNALYEPHRDACERIYGAAVPGAVILDAISASKGDAERKAADKLSVDPLVLAVGAAKLWGRSLTEERDRRISYQTNDDVSPRTKQALRGHTTRQLLTELRQHLDK
jgi:transcriptional regulator with XRE-family HTH domain